jgi:hypothetical protein
MVLGGRDKNKTKNAPELGPCPFNVGINNNAGSVSWRKP